MNYVYLLADAGNGFNFTIDLNTVMMGLIVALVSIIGWFTRKWGAAIEGQVAAIHADLTAHNDKSDKTHERIFKAIVIDGQRISKIEGQLESRED